MNAYEYVIHQDNKTERPDSEIHHPAGGDIQHHHQPGRDSEDHQDSVQKDNKE